MNRHPKSSGLLLLLLLVTACSPLAESTSTATEIHPTATLSTSIPNQTFVFLIQQLVNGERVSMNGLTQGILVTVDGCIRLKEENSDLSHLIIWPPGYKVSVVDGVIHFLNDEGKFMAKVGDEAKISGGGIKIFTMLPEYIQDQIPSTCAAPY